MVSSAAVHVPLAATTALTEVVPAVWTNTVPRLRGGAGCVMPISTTIVTVVPAGTVYVPVGLNVTLSGAGFRTAFVFEKVTCHTCAWLSPDTARASSVTATTRTSVERSSQIERVVTHSRGATSPKLSDASSLTLTASEKWNCPKD